MNAKQRRIQILRESMLKIARTLAGRDIRITQAGREAFVRYGANGKPERLNIPILPDDASDDLINATHGFLDHEVGHVLFTDFEYIGIANEAHCHALFNQLEDVYVERMMQLEFTGSGYNLSNMREIFIERYINPEFLKLKALEDSGTKVTQKQYWQILSVCAIRAWAGQDSFIDYMSDKWGLVSKVNDLLDPFKSRIPEIISSAESCEIAMDMKKVLMGEPPKKPESDEDGDEDGDEGEGEGEGEGKSEDEGEDEGEDEIGGASKKSDKTETSNDDTFVDEGDEGDEGNEGDEDNEDNEGDEGDDESAADDSENKDEGDSEPSSEEGDESDSEPNDDADDSDDLGDNSDSDDSKAGSGNEGGDDATDYTAADSDGSESGGDNDFDGVGGDQNNKEIDDESRRASGKVRGSEYVPPITFDEEEIEKMEASEKMEKMITDMASECIATSSDYKPFTRDVDITEPVKLSSRYQSDHLQKVEEKVSGMIGVLAKNLERAFRAANRSRWEGGKKSGRLSSAALSKLLHNDPRVMRKREEMKTRDVAVTLLIDQSGSMSGQKIKVASEAAWALAQTMNKLNLPVEVIGFTTCSLTGSFAREIGKELEHDMRNDEHGAYSPRGTWHRFEPIHTLVYKDFNEGFGIQQKARLTDLHLGNQPMRNNVDGESLLYAAERLRKRPEPGKVMIVLSDGEPAAGGNMQRMRDHLKKVVKDLNSEGINTVGIGIDTDCVKRFYPKHVVLSDVSQLPKEVMHRLREAILAKA